MTDLTKVPDMSASTLTPDEKAALAKTPIRKPRKPRTPKVKPPKKERVGLGAIKLMVPFGSDLQFTNEQPPEDIAHDLTKVVAWAATVPGLFELCKPIKLVRIYNVDMTLRTEIKYTARVAAEKKQEVVQNNQTV